MKFNKEIFDKVIDNIPIQHGILSEYKTRAIITGTFMFCTYGLMPEFGDIDIVIDGLNSDLADSIYDYCMVNNLQINHKKNHHYLSMEIENGGFIYNILCTNDYMYDPVMFTDESKRIGFDRVENALAIKMGFNREKDKKHLEYMIEIFENYTN